MLWLIGALTVVACLWLARHTRSRAVSSRGSALGGITSFDLSAPIHVAALDEIRERYSSLLANDVGMYAGCLYRPASMLPYPKKQIREALSTLLTFVDGQAESPLLDADLRTPEASETIRKCILSLDDFLDIPEHDLPTDPMENVVVGTQFIRTTRPAV